MNFKRYILVYAVIFLAVLNVATFATIGYHIKETKKGNAFETTDNIEENQPKYNGRYFRDRLGLSQVQMDSFRIINSNFRTNAREINHKLNLLRNKMLVELNKTASDNNILNEYSDSIGLLHAELKKHTAEYYLGISNICSEDQKRELHQIFEEFFISDLHMGNPNGKGKHRHGQQTNK